MNKQPKKPLDFEKMIDDIDTLVNTDFVADMEMRSYRGATGKYTQEESKKMAQLLTKTYWIAHCNTCTSCNGDYLI